jgi:integrase
MLKATTLCQQYLQENFWLAKSTRETTERAFKYFATACGNREIDRIETSDGEKFKGYMLQRHNAKNSVNMYLRAIKSVLTWASTTKKLIEGNSLTLTHQFKVTRNPVRIYEDYDIERMIQYAPSLRWKGIILCAWTTGLRRGEITNLTVDNIRNGYIWVEPKKNTSKTWEWEAKDKEIRRLPLVPQLKEIVENLDCYYLFLSQKRYASLIFKSSLGLMTEDERKCPEQNFRRTFVTIQRKAFGRQVGDFHQFRKTYITKMCEQLPQHFVMQLSGHSNLKTLTYYQGVRESYYDSALKIASKAIKKDSFVSPRESQATTNTLGGTGLEPVTSCV